MRKLSHVVQILVWLINKMLNLSNNSSGTVLILLGANPTSSTELFVLINNELKILLCYYCLYMDPLCLTSSLTFH